MLASGGYWDLLLERWRAYLKEYPRQSGLDLIRTRFRMAELCRKVELDYGCEYVEQTEKLPVEITDIVSS